MIEHIKQLLEREQYYFMYPAGSGGEFLSNIISNQSNKFRDVTSTFDALDNRTIIKLPPIWDVASSFHKLPYGNIDFLSNKILNALENNKFNVIDEVKRANDYLDIVDKPPLIRIHVLFNSYFNNKTFLLVPDKEKWYTYCTLLSRVKVYIRPIKRENFNNFFARLDSATKNPIVESKVNATKKFLDQHLEISEITIAQVEASIFEYGNLHPSTAFNTDSLEIVKRFPSGKFEPTFTQFHNSIPSDVHKNYTIIPFSKIFEYGYLEQLFNITSAQFHQSILNWHNSNTELLNKYGLHYE